MPRLPYVLSYLVHFSGRRANHLTFADRTTSSDPRHRLGLLVAAAIVLTGCAGESAPETGYDFDTTGVGVSDDAGDGGSFCAGYEAVNSGESQDWDANRERFLAAGFPDEDQKLATGEKLPRSNADVQRGYQIYIDVLRTVDPKYYLPDAVGSFENEYPDEPDAAEKFLGFIEWSENYCALVKPPV